MRLNYLVNLEFTSKQNSNEIVLQTLFGKLKKNVLCPLNFIKVYQKPNDIVTNISVYLLFWFLFEKRRGHAASSLMDSPSCDRVKSECDP